MIGSSAAVLAAAPFKWATILRAQPAVPPFLQEFSAEAATAAPAAPAASGAASGGRFAGLSAEARKQQLLSEVSGVITNLLGTGGFWRELTKREGDACTCPVSAQIAGRVQHSHTLSEWL